MDAVYRDPSAAKRASTGEANGRLPRSRCVARPSRLRGLLWRARALPAYVETSIATASASHSQSNPVTPPGATITYMIVVHGRKITPRSGQMNVWNVACILSGWNIHQMRKASRGAPASRTANRQQPMMTP